MNKPDHSVEMKREIFLKTVFMFAVMLLTVMVFNAGSIRAYAKDSEKVIPVYRLYNETNKEHLYTTSDEERNNCIAAGWKNEGIGWYAPQKSDWPVRRLYHAPSGSHVYSQNPVEMDMLTAAGWKLEGVAFYSSQSKAVEIRRQYLPALNLHNYSYNDAEIELLRNAGWKIEGTAWFAAKTPKGAPIGMQEVHTYTVEITPENWSEYFTLEHTYGLGRDADNNINMAYHCYGFVPLDGLTPVSFENGKIDCHLRFSEYGTVVFNLANDTYSLKSGVIISGDEEYDYEAQFKELMNYKIPVAHELINEEVERNYGEFNFTAPALTIFDSIETSPLIESTHAYAPFELAYEIEIAELSGTFTYTVVE